MEEGYPRQVNCYNKVAELDASFGREVTTYKRHIRGEAAKTRREEAIGPPMERRQENQLNW